MTILGPSHTKVLAFLAGLLFATACHAQSRTNNILGTAGDFLNGSPTWETNLESIPSAIARFQAPWKHVEPAKGVYDFTGSPFFNDRMLSNAVARGQTLLIDIWDWPDWIMTNSVEWGLRYPDQQGYVTNLLLHIRSLFGDSVLSNNIVLGCWNEFGSAITFTEYAIFSNADTSSFTSTQRVAEYVIMCSNIFIAKQLVNPAVKLDICKSDGFHLDYLQLLSQCLGTNLCDYVTWHVQYGASAGRAFAAMTNFYGNGWIDYSANDTLNLARINFPKSKIGSDEWYTNDLSNSVAAATCYRTNSASVLVDMLMAYNWPGSPPGDTNQINWYGATNDQLNATSIAIIHALLPDGTNVNCITLTGWSVVPNH